MIEKKNKTNKVYFWGIVIIIILFSIVLKLLIFSYPHKGIDEVVYWQLTENFIKTGHYNILGTDIIERLPSRIYDKSLFHHPPLYMIFLIPFVLLKLKKYAVIINYLGHALCIISVALIGRSMVSFYSFKRVSFWWLPIFGIAIDPTMMFVSRKLWMDGLLAGLISFSITLFYLSGRSKNKLALLFLGSVFWGLAVMTKFIALIIMPIIVMILFFYKREFKSFRMAFFWAFIPCLTIIMPWFVNFYFNFGCLFPYWIKADAQLIALNPYIEMCFRMPWHYFFSILFFVQPLFLFCPIAYFTIFKKERFLELVIPVTWILIYLFFCTFYSLKKELTPEIRYLTPVIPAIYIIIYPILLWLKKTRGLFIILSIFIFFYSMFISIKLLHSQKYLHCDNIFYNDLILL